MERRKCFEKMTEYDILHEWAEESVLDRLIKEVKNRNHVILSGPPGTGKTRSIDIALSIMAEEISHIETIQFHPSYSYQDFVEGYAISNGKYEPQKGQLLKFLDQVQKANSEKIAILVIDEINRGDIPSIFGELMMLLDSGDSREVKTSKFSTKIRLPDNVIILGTMNTADKSVKQLDLALRRRFKFLFVKPDYAGLAKWLNDKGWVIEDFSIDEYVDAVKKINDRIIAYPTLGKNMTLGQSLFVPRTNQETNLELLCDVFNDTILPQLEAYIGFGNKNDLDEILGTPDIRLKLMKGDTIKKRDVISLIAVLNSAQE